MCVCNLKLQQEITGIHWSSQEITHIYIYGVSMHTHPAPSSQEAHSLDDMAWPMTKKFTIICTSQCCLVRVHVLKVPDAVTGSFGVPYDLVNRCWNFMDIDF